MKIEIKDTVVGSKPSDRAAAIIFRLNAKTDDESFIRDLDLINLEDDDEDVSIKHFRLTEVSKAVTFEITLSIFVLFLMTTYQLDLSHWVSILDKFDRILSAYIMFIPRCGLALSFDDDHSHKDAVCSILRFLKALLKRGKKKKYFQSFEVRTNEFSIQHLSAVSVSLHYMKSTI